MLSGLTIEEQAGVLDTQSVGGYAGVVPIVLFSHVGDEQNCGGSQGLDVDGLRAGQPEGGNEAVNKQTNKKTRSTFEYTEKQTERNSF